MAWTVEILGMSGPECWTVSDLPPDGEGQDRVIAARFPGLALERESRRGTRLRYIARPHGAVPRRRGPELSLVALDGPDAGHVVPLARGGITVGRGGSRWQLADPAAPARPVRLSPTSAGITVDDDGPAPWQDGAPITVGATDLAVVRGPGDGLPSSSAPPLPRVDTSGAPAPMSMVLPTVMAVGPLLLGIVLAVTTGRAFFLLFGLLSIVAVTTMLGLQRRARSLFRRRLSARVDELIAARDRSAPEPSSVSLACRSQSADRFALLPGRRPEGHRPAFPELPLRWGTALGEVPLDDPVRQERWRPDTVRRQPALTTLSPGSTVTVCGVGPEHDGAVRWLLLQLLLQTCRHGLGLVVCADDAGVLWRRGPADAGVRISVPAARAVGPILRAWSRHGALRAQSADHLPHDADDWAEVAVTAAAVRDTSARDGEDTVDLDSGVAVLDEQGQLLRDLTPCEVSNRTAAWWAAELASDVTATGPDQGEEASPTPLRVPTTPGACPAVGGLVAPLTGSNAGERDGTVLDLVADGPHVLVAGTTGSGKSDLLLGLLTGLCASHPPAEVALVLLDFKGGASFSCLEGLPHTMSVETNHVAAASLRALDAIGAELRRREELFARHRVSDYPSFRRAVPDAVLPRLVVAVDELRVLVDEHPESSEVLRRLAATGRSLGFHLVLATQRATGTVTSDIRSNLGSVLCLRTASEQESWDLTGSAVASRIPRDRPGTVVHVRQGCEPRVFRAATWVRSDAPSRWHRHDGPVQDPLAPTVWTEVVAELTEVSRSSGPALPEPILSPPLPETWAPDPADSPATVPLALVDDTAAGRHRRLDWEAGSAGSTAWLVETGGGRDLLLTRLRQDLAAAGDRVLHLDGLVTPTTAASCWTKLTPDPDDPDLLDAVLSEIDALGRSGGTLLITGWAAWSSLRCPKTYRGLEDLLLQRLGTDTAQGVRIAAVGGRELSSSRLLAQLPRRLHVPAGTTPEQRMMWPRLTEVLPVPGRAVLIDPDHPEPGIPAQLPVPAQLPFPAPPSSAPR